MGKKRVRCLLGNQISADQISVFDTREDRIDESVQKYSVLAFMVAVGAGDDDPQRVPLVDHAAEALELLGGHPDLAPVCGECRLEVEELTRGQLRVLDVSEAAVEDADFVEPVRHLAHDGLQQRDEPLGVLGVVGLVHWRLQQAPS